MSDLFCAARILLAAPANAAPEVVRSQRPAHVWADGPSGLEMARDLGIGVSATPATLGEVADQCRGETALVVGTPDQLCDWACVLTGQEYAAAVRLIRAGEVVAVLLDADGATLA